MAPKKEFTLALLGNPNSGKSSVFNLLTGLRQKIGNFPGITVDKKLGKAKLSEGHEITIIDFPGTYSLFPTSQDEKVVTNVFSNPKDVDYPDAVVYVADITNLEKQLLLLTQVRDLGFPIVLALNMTDVAEKEGIFYDPEKLSTLLKIPVIPISGRSGQNIKRLKTEIEKLYREAGTISSINPFYTFSKKETQTAIRIQKLFELDNPYLSKIYAHHYKWLPFLSKDEKKDIERICEEENFEDLRMQIRETMQRYNTFLPIVQKVLKKSKHEIESITDKIDAITTHRFFGPLIFFLLMLLVFQAIFAWSVYPMDWIEQAFNGLNNILKDNLPSGWFTRLLTDGIMAGLGGILVFIPQIAILFFLISILEEVGYMARAVFIFDRLMQKFGLNGRSIVSLVSGGACAIPAVMSTRTISNWKERLITILVTPLISCSARIPVYTVLIGFVVPSVMVWKIFNLQGLAFMGLYLLGIIAALISAFAFKLILKSDESSYLMIELPEYQPPMMKNVLLTVKEKVVTFIVEAGKVIMVVSIILWVLASFGPGNKMQLAQENARSLAQERQLDEAETADLIASRQIEASYAGHMGKMLEPVIKPLGFDWKIGIALITSFAAREVFVGTMATMYSIGSETNELRIRDRMAKEINPDTGQPVYSLATSLSLLLFYVFAMQCMSTLAVVRRETRSWKWPIIQFGYMSGLAYLGSLLVYQLFQ